MKRRSAIAFAALFAFLFTLAPSCGKEEISIGNGAPEKEILKCVNLTNKKKFEEAIECLRIFKSKFPKSQYGIDAELKIADNYFDQKEYRLAADTYLTFTKLYPYDAKLDYAYYRAGLSYLKDTPKAIDRDQEFLDDAIYIFKLVLRNFPESPYYELAEEALRDAEGKIARRNFYIGRFYYRTGEYIAAAPRFKTIVDEYPQTGILEKALYFLAKSQIKIRDLEGAKTTYGMLTVKFPNTRYSKKIENKLLGMAEKMQKKEE